MFMKWIRYSMEVPLEEGRVLLYNYTNDMVLALTEELYQLLLSYKNAGNVEALASIHPSLYEELKKKAFIIPSDVQDCNWAISQLNRTLRSKKYFA